MFHISFVYWSNNSGFYVITLGLKKQLIHLFGINGLIISARCYDFSTDKNIYWTEYIFSELWLIHDIYLCPLELHSKTLMRPTHNILRFYNCLLSIYNVLCTTLLVLHVWLYSIYTPVWIESEPGKYYKD